MQNVLDLIKWYKKNFRDLPWRTTKDAYKIWLSEVILQQTQVAQGLNYYHRFITEYPTVSILADASEEQVLRSWQGLGYYSRARNLHKTAKLITNEYQGVFPTEKTDLLKLPGVGDYTASAIASFAFDKPHPAIDGNVFRVISRYYDIELPIDEPATRKVFLEILQPMIEQTSAALFNNAIMELGATLCKNDRPNCSICPLYIDCQARINETIALRPVKSKKVKKRNRFFNYLLIRYKDNIYIKRRNGKDIWEGLFELPLIETNSQTEWKAILSSMPAMISNSNAFSLVKQTSLKHVLTHQNLFCNFYEIFTSEKPIFTSEECLEINLKDSTKFPFPILISNFLLSL